MPNMDQNEAISLYRKYVADNPAKREAARQDFYRTYKVDPEAAGFTRAKDAKSRGPVSDLARKRLANLGMDVAAEQYESDTSKAYQDFAKETAPAIAATVATAGMGTGAIAGKAGWSLFRSLVSGVAQRTAVAGAAGAAGMAAVGGTKEEIIGAGKEQAKMQGFGELMGLGFQGGIAAAKGVKKFAAGAPSGKAFMVERAAQKIERAEEAATELANDFGKPISEGNLTGQAQSFRETWTAKAREEVKDAYRSVSQALEGKRADIRDIADNILEIEKKWAAWRGKAGLKVLTEADPEWLKLVESMQKGQKARTYTINKPALSILGPSGEPLVAAETITKTGKKIPNARENAAALVTARSAAQQALKDIRATGNAPRELEEGLASLLKKIDTKIPQVDAGAGKAMDIAKKAYSENEMIVERALYKAMKTSGDQVADKIMDGRFASNARDFVSMAKKVGGTEGDALLTQMRRKVFDELITRRKGNEIVLDIAGADGKLAQMGENAAIIFGEKAKNLENLGTLAEASRAAEKVRAANVKGPATAAGIWTHILQAGILHRGLGAVTGAAAGGYYSGGTWQASLAGAGVGLVGMNYLPPLILRLSESRVATNTMKAALEAYHTNPRRAAQIANGAVRMVYSKEELDAFAKQAGEELYSSTKQMGIAPQMGKK